MNEERQGRFSDGCVKAALGALAFAALAFGLTEKYRELYRFQSVGQYALGRELLSTGLSQLAEDPCWKAYASTITDPEKVANTSLAQIAGISCDYSQPITARIGSPDAGSTDHSKLQQATPPPPIGNQNTAGLDRAAVPMPPTNITITVRLPLQVSDVLKSAVKILWDDKQLNLAKKYSNSISHEIYQLQKRRVDVAQVRSAILDAQGGAAATDLISNLTLADLEQLNKSYWSIKLTDFDTVLRSNFRADLPNSSVGVTIGTASYATAFAIALFMISIAAYCKELAECSAFKPSSSLLSLMFGAVGYEIVLLLIAIIPPLSLVSLASAIYALHAGVAQAEGFVGTMAWVLMATLVSGTAAIAALRHIVPHLYVTSLATQLVRRLTAALIRAPKEPLDGDDVG